MSLDLPPLHLLQLRFRAVAPIRGLPHYHGPQWNAMFNFILKPYLPAGTTLAQGGFWVHPVETGVSQYETGDPIHLGLTFPQGLAEPVLCMLREFNGLKSPHGHFQPGTTLTLEEIACRLSGQTFSPDSADASLLAPLFSDLLVPEIEALMEKDTISICFHAPLRLKRPEGFKEPGHQWVDPEFLLGETPARPDPPMHLIRSIALPGHSLPETSGLTVSGSALTFLDNTYGDFKIPIGGVMGLMRLSGRPSLHVAAALVAGQYLGLGKNRTFGLGFYHIPDIQQARAIRPLTRAKNLLERAMAIPSLQRALERLPNSSPGPDGLAKGDLKKAGDSFMRMLSCDVLEKAYRPGETATYQQQKKSGGYRQILVQNFTDRLVQRAAADVLQPAVETILSRSAYAFRKGLNRQGAKSALKQALSDGFNQGLKADISAFFDSVNLDLLSDILYGLFPFDPLPDAILSWLRRLEGLGIKGIPQGSPLSPVLSNLYLDRFDKAMAALDLRLIRYADDFVVLVKPSESVDACLKEVETSLKGLGLALNPEKTQRISVDSRIEFLGYCLVSGEEQTTEPAPEEKGAPWPAVFKEDWLTGHPVYLTSLCRGAFSNGPDMVVQMEEEKTENIPWNRISRIVIVGKSSFSGGVVYRAVKEEIPVTFIDVMGRLHGQLAPTAFDPPSMAGLQKRFAKDTDFCLGFAKEIISAKTHNRAVVLRRNDLDLSPLKNILEKIPSAETLDQLRGFEGSADRAYFHSFAALVAPFEFKGRSYHPPEGPVNTMLSFGYSLLYNRLSSVLHAKGYSSRVGFFHLARGRHFALASDLMEELRFIVDRIVLTLIHRKEIQDTDFDMSKKKSGIDVCHIKGEGFRKYIHHFEHTMASKTAYEAGESMSYNSLMDVMADKLTRTLKLGVPYTAMRIK